MPQDLYQYEKMIERALRGVVREALERASREGLRGAHHFYIGFATDMPGVTIPDSVRARYPQDMTIVLQHQFWDLEVGEEGFSVTLSFQSRPERLTIPFAAVRSFADPSVNFALEFASPERPEAAPSVPAPTVVPGADRRARPDRAAIALAPSRRDRFREAGQGRGKDRRGGRHARQLPQTIEANPHPSTPRGMGPSPGSSPGQAPPATRARAYRCRRSRLYPAASLSSVR